MKAEADRLADALERFHAYTPACAAEDRARLDEAAALLRRWPDGEPIGMPTPEMRATFTAAFREGSIWNSRVDYGLEEVFRVHRLYTAPLAKLDGEPVAWLSEDGNRVAFHQHQDYTRPLYTAPPAARIAELEAQRDALLEERKLQQEVLIEMSATLKVAGEALDLGVSVLKGFPPGMARNDGISTLSAAIQQIKEVQR